MLLLENNTTFTGGDIKAYVYRNVDELKNLYNKVQYDKDGNIVMDEDGKPVHGRRDGEGNRVMRKKDNYYSPNGRDELANTSLSDTDKAVASRISDVASGRIKAKPTKYIVQREDGAAVEVDSEEEAERMIIDGSGKSYVAKPVEVDTSSVYTNKVNPNYIDIVRSGSDKAAIEMGKQHQLAKYNNTVLRTQEWEKKFNVRKPIVELGSLHSITYSSFREKTAIRTLGRVSAKGYVRGQRTVAGSMNFIVFQSHELMDFLRGKDQDEIGLLDQLPKFNLMLLMINEYGGASILHLFGVTISTEAMQASVDDLALINSVTFYAEDIMTIENVGNIWETSLAMLHPTVIAGRSLQFYKKGAPSTLEDMFNASEGQDPIMAKYLQRSRGLF